MRAVLGFAVVAVAAMFQAAVPATAATWSCVGPAYVCGSSDAAPAYKKVSHNKASKKAYQQASYDYDAPLKSKKAKKYAASKSYSSGGSTLSGKASYYWQPQRVASGGWFNPNAMTAAHKTLPFGTKGRVTNKNNGKSVVVTINDRGPYVAGRVIDLSKAAAHAISMQGSGVVPVSVAVLGRG